jgi:hypothetical protein
MSAGQPAGAPDTVSPTTRMARLRETGRRAGSRQWISLIIVVVLAFAIVIPPLFNIERYQHRIADNISRSLGRPVHFSHISLRLLPRPGFDLTDFTIEEGPGFGAEPILHSSSVSASIRLLSLWRGRLEIAHISLEEPSLNLVRQQGRWNFASVMTQASRTSIAPTGQIRPSRTLRFPYIEATHARVNFKYGDEKQPFSFMDGDIAIWLENPTEWQLRFKAQPVRTDLDLYASDTGTVRIEGSMQRAASLGSVPLNLRVDWEHAPLGQIDRLFGGPDQGWHGDLEIRSRVKGTPDKLMVHSTLDLTALHRVEFAPERALDYSAQCDGIYEKSLAKLDDLKCVLPLGNGNVTMAGTITPHAPELNFALNQVPASAILSFLRLERQGLGENVQVGGTIGGGFALSEADEHFLVTGNATAEKLAIRGAGLDKQLLLDTARVTALPAIRNARNAAASTPASLLLTPVKIDLGGPSPVLMDGRFDHRGFAMHFGGNAALAKLVPLIQSLGSFAPGLQAMQPVGEASLDVMLRGPWLIPLDAYGAGAPGAGLPGNDGANAVTTPTGTITLHDAKLVTPYLSAPLAIRTAQASLFGKQIAWSGIVAQYGPVHFTGNFRAPLPCAAGDACVRQFDLTIPSVDLAVLPGVIVGNSPLMQVILHRIEDGAISSEWPPLHGTIRTATATLGTLNMQDAVATLDVAGANIKIDSFDAQTLEGTIHLSGAIQAGSTPVYSIEAQLNEAAVPAIGQLFHQSWGTGEMNATAHFTMSGSTQSELLASTRGQYHLAWSKGGLQHVAVKAGTPASPFLHFDQWTADGTIANSAFTLEQSLLTNSDGAHAIQGTIGFDRRLELKSSAASSGVQGPASSSSPANAPSPESGELTGTMAEPSFSLDNPAQP